MYIKLVHHDTKNIANHSKVTPNFIALTTHRRTRSTCPKYPGLPNTMRSPVRGQVALRQMTGRTSYARDVSMLE